MGQVFAKHKLLIISVIFLALLTPFMVQFITNNQTSLTNYASEGSDPTITLNPGDTPLILGSEVTFKTTYPANTKNPRVEVLCYQYDKFTFGTAGGVDFKFRLGGTDSQWISQYPNDPAQCVANLYYFEESNGKQVYNLLATTSFDVEGK